jgi:hypothetical protein
VPPHAVVPVSYDAELFQSDVLKVRYEEAGGETGEAFASVQVEPYSVRLAAAAPQTVEAAESATVAVELENLLGVAETYRVRLEVTDNYRHVIHQEELSFAPSLPGVAAQQSVSFLVPPSTPAGTLYLRATAFNHLGEPCGSDLRTAQVLAPRLTIALISPDEWAESTAIGLRVQNLGSATARGEVTAELISPIGVPVWQGVQPVLVAPGASGVVTFVAQAGPIVLGSYELRFVARDQAEEVSGVASVLSHLSMITGTEPAGVRDAYAAHEQVVPYVQLYNGGDFRLDGTWSYGNAASGPLDTIHPHERTTYRLAPMLVPLLYDDRTRATGSCRTLGYLTCYEEAAKVTLASGDSLSQLDHMCAAAPRSLDVSAGPSSETLLPGEAGHLLMRAWLGGLRLPWGPLAFVGELPATIEVSFPAFGLEARLPVVFSSAEAGPDTVLLEEDTTLPFTVPTDIQPGTHCWSARIAKNEYQPGEVIAASLAPSADSRPPDLPRLTPRN